MNKSHFGKNDVKITPDRRRYRPHLNQEQINNEQLFLKNKTPRRE